MEKIEIDIFLGHLAESRVASTSLRHKYETTDKYLMTLDMAQIQGTDQ